MSSKLRQVIQSPESIQAKAEARRLNEDLERIARKTPEPPFILRYGVAVLAVIVALIIDRLLNIHLVGAPAMLFLCALMFSAWYGGAKPALLAMPLAVLAFAYYFVTPTYTFAIDVREIPRLSLFVLASLFVISLSAAQKRASRSLRHAHDVLAGTVEELKRTNQALRTENTERKQAENELREQKETLQKIFDYSPVLISFFGEDGRLNLANREWERTFGWTLEEIKAQNVEVLAECYPDPRERRRAQEFIAATEGQWADFRVRVRDGRVLETAWANVRLSDGTSVGIGQDITQRKQSEEALRKSEDHLRLVLDTTPALIHTGRPDGYLDYFNQRWLNYVGLSLEDLQGWRWTDSIHPDDVEGIVSGWRASLASAEPFQCEARVRRADGEYCWMLHHKVPSRDEDGTVVKWYGSSIDIEDRKRAEEALRRSEDHLRLVIDTIPVMTWSTRPDGVVDFLSKRWRDYAGVSLERYVQDPSGPIHPDDIPKAFEKWRAVMAEGELYEEEMRLQRADGEYRWFLVRTAPLRDESGNIVKWYGVSMDIDDRKRAEEQLKATSAQLRALSASRQSAREEESTRIAREIHDELGAALTSLRWDLEAIEDAISEASDATQLAALRKKVATMITLTETTLNTVKRLASEIRPVALDELGLVEAIEWQAAQFETRTGIEVQFDCALEKADLNGEQSTAVFRILQETLTNILRHAEATKVIITVTQKAGEFLLTIEDNGRGITESEKSGAYSLGLLGMRERADLISAQIDITGIEGEGTLVAVRIPLSVAERT